MSNNKKRRKINRLSAAIRKAGGLHPNTELCVDLKTYTSKPGPMDEGILVPGLMCRDNGTHVTFIETGSPAPRKRNPHIYDGRHITATINADGIPRLNFRPLRNTDNLNVETLAKAVADEIRAALSGLAGNRKSTAFKKRKKS